MYDLRAFKGPASFKVALNGPALDLVLGLVVVRINLHR